MYRYLVGLAIIPSLAAPFYFSKEEDGFFYQSLRSYALGFLVALFCTYVVPLRHCPSNPLLSHMVERRKDMNKRYAVSGTDSYLAYGLEQTWFNASLEPQTLWVNLGFWEKATHPSEACADLFRKLLENAGVADQSEFSVFEVGCGCAETAHVLLNEYQNCSGWVGLNLSAVQVQVADDRLREAQSSSQGKTRCKIFQADAAKPSTWSAEIRDSVRSLPNPWLVGIDTLVDFLPSRKGILAYARQELGASVAITDHVKMENLSMLDTFRTWASFRLMDAPLNQVLTKQQYIDLLVECGYKEENVSFVPYTQHVYAPYSRFIQKQGQRWQEMGGSKWDYMDFSIAGYVCDWWARTGLAEAYMIIARA